MTAKQLEIDEKEIKLKSRFKEDLGADSLDHVEIVMQVEKAFDLLISDEDADKLRTVGSVVNFIAAHASKATLAQLCLSNAMPTKSK